MHARMRAHYIPRYLTNLAFLDQIEKIMGDEEALKQHIEGLKVCILESSMSAWTFMGSKSRCFRREKSRRCD
jgi:hypothetical protein